MVSLMRTTAAAFFVVILALMNQGVAHAANLDAELAAHSSALDSLSSLVLLEKDVLIVTQTTIEEPTPCPLLWASRAMGRFFQRPCCSDLLEQAKVQHMVNHLEAMTDTVRKTLPAMFRPKSKDVRELVQQWLQQEAKESADAPKSAEQQPADSLGAV